MSYQITIIKTEPNPNLEKDREKYDADRRMGLYRNEMVALPQEEVRKNVLMVELTDDQYKKVKVEVLKTFE